MSKTGDGDSEILIGAAALREWDACGLWLVAYASESEASGEGYEVEFMTLASSTIAVATVLAGQCRPITKRDISHVRAVVAA